jgi:hypothetical protein
MTSSVFFKFKSQKDPTRVEFDGTGISVFELKRDIIIKSGLGDGKDFDLAIYNEDGNEGEPPLTAMSLLNLTNQSAQNTMMTLRSFPDLLPLLLVDFHP